MQGAEKIGGIATYAMSIKFWNLSTYRQKSTRKIIQTHTDYLKSKDTLMINYDGTDNVQQKLGFKTVCKNCNNKVSGGYVNGFNSMVKQLIPHVKRGLDGRIVTIRINPRDVIKQILYMFLAQNYELKMYPVHKILYEIVKDRKAIYVDIDGIGQVYMHHVARIYMAFCTSKDLVYHTDQVARANLPNITLKGNQTASIGMDMKQFWDNTRIGACENIISFTPFFFKLVVGLDATQDTDSHKLLNISGLNTFPNDGLYDVSLSMIEYKQDLPPKSFKSSSIKTGEKWEVK